MHLFAKFIHDIVGLVFDAFPLLDIVNKMFFDVVMLIKFVPAESVLFVDLQAFSDEIFSQSREFVAFIKLEGFFDDLVE